MVQMAAFILDIYLLQLIKHHGRLLEQKKSEPGIIRVLVIASKVVCKVKSVKWLGVMCSPSIQEAEFEPGQYSMTSSEKKKKNRKGTQ
jgi:hypothetical protein